MMKFKKNIFLILAFLVFANVSKAQWYKPEKVNKKAIKVYEAAYDLAVEGDYEKSLNKLDEALAIEPKYVEAYLSRAGIYGDLKNYNASVTDFSKAFSLDSIFSSTYLLPYSISLAGIGNFELALEKVNAFLNTEKLNSQSIKSGNYRKRTYEFALEYKRNHPTGDYHFDPVNLGDGINTNYLEYYPSLTIDGKKMIFTRRVNNDEDFYESENINGVWSKATPAKGKINTTLNEGAQSISQDGQWLIFTGCNYPEGQGSCDLYISFKTKSGSWTEAENIGPIVNTDLWESAPSLSPDKKDLYFSSNRFNGYGGKDIWVTHRNNLGKWTVPENLGLTINTSGDETCPFIHPDNQTLYFNSNGLPGYGMADLFLTRKGADNKWTTPLNLGYPINTIDDEGSLIVASDGYTSYYASDRKNKNSGLDIYSFILPKELSAKKTLWINGNVFDAKSKLGLPSMATLTCLGNANFSTQIQTDEDGNFLITLPIGYEYSLNINRKGYLFYSDHFSLPENTTDSFFKLNVPLQPIEAGASIVLKNIFFGNNETKLQPESEAELNKIIVLLNENPNMKVQISGHTDNVGKKEANQLLSLNRAKSVVNYLIGKGITINRLLPKGFGDTKPVASNDTDEGKSLNRRTEINVVSN
jgi:outer membrane protein OmpA-like peptidoglycan-associated protein/tetratricopeptide (TPR) repeat protein